MENGCTGWKDSKASDLLRAYPEIELNLALNTGHATYQNLCIRLQNSSERCWVRNVSRKREGGNIRERESPSLRQREKKWSLPSKRSHRYICQSVSSDFYHGYPLGLIGQ